MLTSKRSPPMTRIFALTLLAAALSAAPVKSKTSSTRQKTGPHSTVRAAHGHARRRAARTPPAPSFQLHPDGERYTQIQQALADRGYYKGQANGVWNDESTDALKRFQADQKLEADGKINALTLTGLGLGPRHDGSSASTVPLSAAAGSTEMPDPGAPPPITDPQ